jgi:hypothetical protein
MNELTCQQCQDAAAELALDVLPCHERACALAHLEVCTSCQDTVSALTVTADRLIELLPTAQPPAGFERRVISALVPPAPRPTRWWIPAAATLLALGLAAGGWILGRSDSSPLTATDASAHVGTPTDERTVMYAPLTTAQHQIGNAYAYPGPPGWIYLAIDGGPTSNTVHCDVVRHDGSAVRVGTFPLDHGHGAWGGPAPVDRNALTTARLTDGHGTTLAVAHFGPAAHNRPQPASHPDSRSDSHPGSRSDAHPEHHPDPHPQRPH